MQSILMPKLSDSLKATIVRRLEIWSDKAVRANDHRALYDADGASLQAEIRAAPEQQLRLIL